MSDIVEVNHDQVISTGKGKIRFISKDGVQVSLPKARVKIVQTQSESQSLESNAPTESAAAPVEAEVSESAQPKSDKEKTVAKSKKKASAKTGAKGVHKLGDAVFNLDKYEKVKTAAGSVSYHNGDEVAKKLAGKDLNEVYDIVAAKLGVSDRSLKDKYRHLNAGQQRMNLGNRMRKALKPKTEKVKKVKKAA